MRPLDEILGLKKTASTHDFKIGDRVKTIRMSAFREGREGEIVSLDQWNRPVIKLDICPNLEFPLHHSCLERIGSTEQ